MKRVLLLTLLLGACGSKPASKPTPKAWHTEASKGDDKRKHDTSHTTASVKPHHEHPHGPHPHPASPHHHHLHPHPHLAGPNGHHHPY